MWRLGLQTLLSINSRKFESKHHNRRKQLCSFQLKVKQNIFIKIHKYLICIFIYFFLFPLSAMLLFVINTIHSTPGSRTKRTLKKD